MAVALRSDLPELPERMRSLPLDPRGYPVPFFVAWVDGVPDFRAVDSRKLKAAVERRLCWLCGQPLGRFGAFVIGPMCALNRTTAEPPCHRECAVFAARACPFLSRPHMRRRTNAMPEGWSPPAGVGLTRNPGVTLVWVTRTWKPFVPYPVANELLFSVGDPTEALWFSEGREATREECSHSIETGLPLLLADTKEHAPAELEEAVHYAAEQLKKTRAFLPGKASEAERPPLEVVRSALRAAETMAPQVPWGG